MLFQPHQSSFGLDLGDRSLKAIQFRPRLRGGWELAAVAQLDLPDNVFKEGEIKDLNGLISSIKQLIAQPKLGRFSTSYVTACLPETKTFIKMIDIPPMPEDEIPQAVRWEAEHHIPIPIDETYWDWQRIGVASKANDRLPVLLGVVPREISDTYSQALTSAGLVPLALEIEAVAITRSLLPIETQPKTDDKAAIIIDLGASRTSLILVDRSTIQFTVSLPISGRQITSTIATNLQLNETQAEKAKIVCGLDPKKCHGTMGEILKSMMDELVRRIHEAMVFYREHFPHGHDVTQVILCGGGANFKYIDEHLTDKLAMPVKRGNPWVNLAATPAPLKPAELLGYTTAIGLAIRSSQTNNHDTH